MRIDPNPDDRRVLCIVTIDAFIQWDLHNRTFQENFIKAMFRDFTAEAIGTMKRAQLKLYNALQNMKEGKTT